MDLFKLVGRILISNEEANSAIDETTRKAEGLGKAIEDTGTSADTASGKLGEKGGFSTAAVYFGELMFKLTEKAVSLGTNLAKIGFNFNASMESYQYSFSALLGDADKAAGLVADLQELAKVSPLGMEGLANNAVSLLSTGTELKDIIPTLEMLGNLALGDTNKMASVVRAYTQIMSKGSLMAQEMWQMSDAGVPIIEIMTKFGGDRYADGEWLMEKLSDKDYVIPAEDFLKAFQGAVAEGGKWHDYMFMMMDSYAGQYDRLGEEGKETLGAFMQPFFDMAKSEVLPGLIDSLDRFRTWISDNQEPLQKLADSIGNIVNVGFDMLIGAFEWMIQNGEALKIATIGIAAAMTYAAIAAHPYAVAVTAVAAALALMAGRNLDGDPYNHWFDGYTDEELATLQKWVDAVNEYNAALEAWDKSGSADDESAFNTAADKLAKARKDLDAIEGLLGTYESWRTGQAENTGKNLYLDVPLRVSDDSESNMQTTVDGMDIESVVSMVADTSGIQYAVDMLNLTATVGLVPGTSGGRVMPTSMTAHSHATGLWRVPYDGYLARLHDDEMVLNSTNADAVRNGMFGGTGRLESMMSQLLTLTQQMVANTGRGSQVVLDSGVLVGQIAPAMDVQLGTISARKGRRS